jgi:hypothetical protein
MARYYTEESPVNKPKKRVIASSNASYDTLCWIETNYIHLARHMGEDLPLSEFDFPNQECYTYASLVVDGKDGAARLADMMKQKAQIEKSEKKQRSSAATDDLRRNLYILKALRRHIPGHLRREKKREDDYSESVLG